ncbi:tetratricopeptide repeat protein [Neiella marina]|uniref:Ancillary SecYEG translocon subunit n=1 Tax=Neiella holothuriorum TaxID=2870530 RepID=A0ABS7EEU3_9GAMM|nr:tetratricopeptide repeat protein [Neiella holothuriorum]MBW8190862.1 tetratricopeptide repeat protein [Neiella holothuriorum]
MEAYQTEEQQIEAIKAFWRKNGNQIILGIVIGLGGIYGFRYFQEQQVLGNAEAAQAYSTAATAEQLQQFSADYSDSGYVAVAELQLAKTQVEAGELEAAAATLKQVAANASDVALQQVAKLRLARIQVGLAQAEQALQTLSGEWPALLVGDVESVKAEAHLVAGNVDAARDALQTALMNVPPQLAATIQIRLDDLAAPAPELPAAATAVEE